MAVLKRRTRTTGVRPRWWAMTGLLAVSLIATSCSGGASEGTSTSPTAEGQGSDQNASDGAPVDGGILRWAHNLPVSSLDPVRGNAGSDHQVLYNIYDTLIEFEPATLKPEPNLASDWEYEDDVTLVLHLVEGVEFTDGTPFNAEAVKYNLERAANHPDSHIVADVETIESVEVRDDLTAVIHLTQPNAALPLALADRAGMMVSPTAAEALGDELEFSPVGTGAFVVDEYRTDDRLVLSANESYWKENLPHFDGMEVIILPSQEARASALEAGQVDLITNTPARDIVRFDAAGGMYQTYTNPTVYLNMVYVNWAMAPLDDIRVRQAMNFAIDRESIFEGVYGGRGEVGWTGPILPTHWAFGDADPQPYPYDEKKAASLLSEAGYSASNPPAIDFRVGTTSDEQRVGQLMEEQLEAAGFDVTLHVVDRAVSSEMMFLDKAWHMQLSAWTGRPDPDTTMRLLFSPDAYFNAAEQTPEDMVEMMNEAAALQEPEERAEIYGPLIDRVMEEGMIIPLAWQPDSVVHTTSVEGYTPNLLGKPKLAETWLAADE